DDGDLTLYLESLRKLRQLPTRLLLPAHGPPTTNAARLIDDAVIHREERERQLVEALAAGLQSAEELAAEMYRGLPAQALPLARFQTTTGLIKLRGEGRAAATPDGRWRLA